MGKHYELWLDESGKFEDRKALRGKESSSLIGGILIEKDSIEGLKLDRLMPRERNHATELRSIEKKKYIISTLEELKKGSKAQLFYIENKTYQSEGQNKTLYLRMMAEGILQLLQRLNALSESVTLDVLIAQRQNVVNNTPEGRIEEENYIKAIDKYIDEKKKRNHISFNKDTKLSFDVKQAQREVKLAFADYACNLRFRKDNAIYADCKDRLDKLFEDAFIFDVIEQDLITYIDTLLANNMIADALIELFNHADEIEKDNIFNKTLENISSKMRVMGYRLVKSQLKQFTSDIAAYTYSEDDYEIGEKLLKNIIDKLIPLLKENNFPYLEHEFKLLILLIDMYLREGDIILAREMVDRCKRVQEALGNSLEEILSYHQIIEKEAILLIDEFRYDEARALVDKECEAFENIMLNISNDKFLRVRFPTLKSEYYGDALCMKIYANMFLQRENPALYTYMCADSDKALKQYPNSEGELERHRQYRSHIELENGNYERALLFLINAKLYTIKRLDTRIIREFLDKITMEEYKTSCQYYLMYYLLIMSEAKRAGSILADDMYKILKKCPKLLEMSYIDDKKVAETEYEAININDATERKSNINYHPVEINFWKYASYLYQNNDYEKAIEYFTKAYKLCNRYKNYTTMRITGIGPLTEMICCYIDQGNKKTALKLYEILKVHIDTLLKESLQPETKSFIKDIINKMAIAEDDGKLIKDNIYNISRMITY